MENIVSIIAAVLLPLLKFLLQFALAWWWLLLPFVLFRIFIFQWLWWRVDRYLSFCRWTLLEVKIPQEVDNPFRRMESVLAGIWQVRIGDNKREKWLEGKVQLGVSLEIASIEGKTHFYLRSENDDIELLKTSVYAQFPNAEITEVEDYSKQVPSDIPNKEWNVWGSVYLPLKDDCYPIKTYKQFFEEQATTSEDEPIRVDPLGQLLEGMAKLGPGEQMWVQIYISPMRPKDLKPYMAKAKSIVDKIVRRPENGKQAGTVRDVESAASLLITGSPLEEEKKEREDLLPPEMRITPGEREIVLGIEEKISKTTFDCFIRTMYVAKNDMYLGAMKATPMSYFNQFTTLHMNGIVVDSDTWTKVHTVSTWFLDKRRLYLRRRRHVRLYRERFPQPWPRAGGSLLLNIEELASLYHFPGKLTAPGAEVPRVESKRSEAPAGLPMDFDQP
ncbi:MAG: hypothetical protein HYS60_02605 [Candidatus Wildermuthbacteria bacterium]|nr:hypothetical protein [Candidatus Wildermuthbacteria bacterium]